MSCDYCLHVPVELLPWRGHRARISVQDVRMCRYGNGDRTYFDSVVYATDSQHRFVWMSLNHVDDFPIALENVDQFRSFAIPDEEVSII